ncbi:MAG TPA: hypothetical protein VF796_08030 [Humisphaera sp.]
MTRSGLFRVAAAALLLAGALLPVAAARAADAKPAYPPPPPADPAVVGTGCQRTMTLLATSTPQRRNKVRILFYGQSITVQEWSKAVADDLKARFPNADLDVRNLAIGGFASQLLIKPAEHDVYPFYPDLVIFHVYGAHDTYEQIIRNIRTRTTAEVLMQTDHVAARGYLEKPDDQAEKGLAWDWKMNNQFLPAFAKKYGCTLLDVRSAWVTYLKQNDLKPQALLKDGVHLNTHGCWLMAELVKRHLVHRPDLPQDGWKGLTSDHAVAAAAGKATLEVEGNRIDVIPAPGKAGTVRVLVDGKKPSEHPGCYAITRPTPGPWTPLTVTRVDHDAPLVLEEWTLTVTGATPDGKGRTYEVVGSVTGKDGTGDTLAPFTSKSGRAKIDPKSFFAGKGDVADVKPGYAIKWKVVPLFADEAVVKADADATRENAVTLAQGIENGKHTVELIAADGGVVPVAFVRGYRPPVK